MNEKRDTAVLGINFSGADPNAAVVVNGRILAAVEEERFIRDKHAAGRFPSRAAAYCIEVARRQGLDIGAVAFGWDSPKYADGRMTAFYESEVNGRYGVDEGTKRWQKWMCATYGEPNVTKTIHDELVRAGLDRESLPPVRFLPHHQTHAAGAYLLSGFEDAAVLTLDGSGDETCTALWTARDGEVAEQHRFPIPHSLGWYYAAMTEFLGFDAYDGEYKVMGLAPYGSRDDELIGRLRRLLKIDAERGTYELDPYLIHYGAHTRSGRYTDALLDVIGRQPRVKESEPSESDKNVSFATQELLEEIGVALAGRATREAGAPRVCLAGGSALNCKMSQRILESEGVEDVFVLPNAGDGGQSLSAALLLDREITGARPDRIRSMALGPEFSDDEIKKILDECLIEHEHCPEHSKRAARDIFEGRVVGWFDGRMEFGPRALGSRSILADPRFVRSRDRVNGVVKYREYWRPFCPSLLAEAAPDYFDVLPSDASFMTITLPVKEPKKKEIEAVVHKDGTSRPQFVHRATQSNYYELIEEFARLSSVPVVLNTSFNVKGEPIVCSPRDAIRNFYSCGMEVLYLGPFRIEKAGLAADG